MLVVAVSSLLAWSFLPASEAGPEASLVVVTLDTPDQSAAIDRLEQAGLVRSPLLMRIYLRGLMPSVRLEPREHLLEKGLSPRELVQRLAGLPRERRTVVVPEGWHLKKIAERLEKKGICQAREFLDITQRRQVLRRLGIPGPTAEGYLFPATYDLMVDSRPGRVAKTMIELAKKQYAEVARQHASGERALAGRGFGMHEVLTLASIVERETAVGEERSLIASVFLNRLADPSLETRGRLQSDPTAVYGCLMEGNQSPSCAKFQGQATPDILRDSTNRYNTYRHAGLPPGPIGSPGKAAIAAVLSPAESDYLYFVADGNGAHQFSRSFEEHGEAVKRLRDQRGRSHPE